MERITQQQLNNKSYLIEKRQNLRKRMTPAEATLWRYLKNKQMSGARFRRQFSVGNYILDFYCHEFKIAIELDGQHHYTEEGRRKDAERTTFLEQQGVRVLRFENILIFKHTDAVLAEVGAQVFRAQKMMSDPSVVS